MGIATVRLLIPIRFPCGWGFFYGPWSRAGLAGVLRCARSALLDELSFLFIQSADFAMSTENGQHDPDESPRYETLRLLPRVKLERFVAGRLVGVVLSVLGAHKNIGALDEEE